MKHVTESSLADGFTVWEKAYAQVSFVVMGVVGTIGILLTDWPWVLPYVAVYWYGVPGVVMRHLLCPRCSHLHVYGDCLQAPAGLTRRICRDRKHTPMSSLERATFYAIFVLIPLYPLYWLAAHRVLLVVFVIAAGAWYLGQYVRFCRQCRVFSCPFNRVPESVRLRTAGVQEDPR